MCELDRLFGAFKGNTYGSCGTVLLAETAFGTFVHTLGKVRVEILCTGINADCAVFALEAQAF